MARRNKFFIFVVSVTCMLLCSCADREASEQTTPEFADVILSNGKIYTVNPAQSWAEAVAIRDGHIMAVGDVADVDKVRGEQTRFVDLAGAMVMPGIVDGHLHPVRGALTLLYKCNFPFSATPEEIVETVANCDKANPDADWITGGQWASGLFDEQDIASPRGVLDEISKSKAIFLEDDALHNAWANSRALEVAGITRDTPDPVGGRIGRDPAGEPNGLLYETAAKMVMAHIPPYSLEQNKAAAVEFSRIANEFGITGARAGGMYESETAGMNAADLEGRLTVHMAVSLRTPNGARDVPLDYADLERQRDQYASTHVDTRYVKIFLDGVPTPGRTAAMLQPYVPAPEFDEGFDGGPTLIPPAVLKQDLVELDKRGFTVKFHTGGDRSVRVALDAIEAARKANGASGLRHEAAHAGYVARDDLERFVSLNAVADLCPVLWAPSPIVNAIVDTVGPERGPQYFPIRTMLERGVKVLAGTDWPAGAASANPWYGLEAMVTRRDPTGVTPGTLWLEEAISLEQAIRVYTLDSAAALRKEQITGSIEVGKSAELIVLDRNLFDIPTQDISDTQVLQTWFEGRLVYEAVQPD